MTRQGPGCRRRKAVLLEKGYIIAKEGFGREYKPLEERRKQLEDQIPVLQGEIDFVKIKFQSGDEVLSRARDLYANWPKLAREEKRNIIEPITEKILVGKGDVSIDLCYLPGSSEIMAKGQLNVFGSTPRTNTSRPVPGRA